MILRQRDANSGWVNAADGTMEERRNYCQNWRSDVSAILTSAGVMVEWGKFTAYGRGPQSRFFGIGVPLPIGLPAGDIDSDFITDTGDVDAIKTWVAAYDVRADLDLDGDIDPTDGALAEGYEGWQLGWNELSHSSVANRLGCAGYHKDVNLDLSHVRNRVLEPHLGRWTRRDPLGYVDGMSLYEYVRSAPIFAVDDSGKAWRSCTPVGCVSLRESSSPHIGPIVKAPFNDDCGSAALLRSNINCQIAPPPPDTPAPNIEPCPRPTPGTPPPTYCNFSVIWRNRNAMCCPTVGSTICIGCGRFWGTVGCPIPGATFTFDVDVNPASPGVCCTIDVSSLGGTCGGCAFGIRRFC
ncbi:MAG: hypothetical protein KJZ69_11685 [Phycisphaerales bacterium]|nr:hypothetical protein [Phycisphaerales bacterium]